MYVVKQQTERYETVETLAEGAMGTVRLARDQLLGRLVAIKTVRLDTVTDPKELARLRESLLHEAEVTQFLSHPNIVTIHEILDDGEGETPSLVMEYVPGSTLAELLRGESPLPLDLALSIVAQIASALDHAHTMGVIHGDIKAANILVGEDEQTIKLADFGIAQMLQSDSDRDNRLYGTPRYVAPELLMGQKADPRSDLYSMGVLLFEMLTGRSPFRATTAAEVTQAIVQGSMDISDSTLQDLPEDLRQILLRLLKRNPEARYKSAEEVLQALGYSTTGPAKLDEAASDETVSDETVATQDLTGLVVPDLPDIGQALEEPDSEAVIDPAPPCVSDPSERPLAASRVQHPWMRYAVVGLVTAVLALSIGWVSFLVLKPGYEERFAGSEAHQNRMQYVPLLKEAHRLLRAGEPAVAARVFRRAEDLAPGLVTISRQRRAAEQEALAVEKHLQIQEEVEKLIEQGRLAVNSRRTSRATQLATAALAVDPENLEAMAILNAVRTSQRQPQSKPQKAKPIEVAQQPEPTERQATVEFPAGVAPAVSQTPRPSELEPTPVASTGMSDLQIDVFSYLPKGVVTIYSDEDQILLQPFRFVRKAGFARRKKSAGRLESSLELPAGTSEFRIYISAEGLETQTVNLTAKLVGGESHVLRLIIAENGSASAQLN